MFSSYLRTARIVLYSNYSKGGDKMDLKNYVKPEVLNHNPIRFETKVSDGGSFPGLGWGVDGVPAKERGDFPGGGATGGVFPGKGPQHNHRP